MDQRVSLTWGLGWYRRILSSLSSILAIMCGLLSPEKVFLFANMSLELHVGVFSLSSKLHLLLTLVYMARQDSQWNRWEKGSSHQKILYLFLKTTFVLQHLTPVLTKAVWWVDNSPGVIKALFWGCSVSPVRGWGLLPELTAFPTAAPLEGAPGSATPSRPPAALQLKYYRNKRFFVTLSGEKNRDIFHLYSLISLLGYWLFARLL